MPRSRASVGPPPDFTQRLVDGRVGPLTGHALSLSSSCLTRKDALQTRTWFPSNRFSGTSQRISHTEDLLIFRETRSHQLLQRLPVTSFKVSNVKHKSTHLSMLAIGGFC